MGDSPWVAAGDVALVADTECRELERIHECMREEQAMGGSPWIAAGDGALVADTRRCELQCSHQCM